MSQASAMQHLQCLQATPSAPFLRVPDPSPRSGLGRLSIRPTLAAQVMRLAAPVVLGMLTQTAINILDMLMVGRLPKGLANPGQAAIAWALPVMWLVGGFVCAIWVGTQAITSRRAGEGNDVLAGRALTNSLLVAAIGGVTFSAAAFVAAPVLMRTLFSDPVVVKTASDYLQVRFIGVLAMVGTFSYKSFFDGVGKTYIFMTAAVVMNLTNVVLNFLLIFGNETLGIPRFATTGAAMASVISAYLGLLILIAWSFLPSYLRRYRYYRWRRLNLWVIKEIIRLSLPNGFATVIVMVGFAAFNVVVDRVNLIHAEAGNPIIGAAAGVLINLFLPTVICSLAVGSATAAIVSQTLGAKRPALGEAYGWEAAKIWAYAMWGYGAVMLLAPDSLIGLLNPDPDVIAVARVPLQYFSVLQGLMAVALIMAQTLYGLGGAKFVMYVELVLHLIVMAPVAALGGLVADLGLGGTFLGPAVYVMILGTAMTAKFRRGDWKEIAI